ncbi:MAG: hemerythrin domain-containing protein [Planctomycetaceae bacterium]|nr:hemerythrin domain-containing protein [Planctomycetaceae bacterium]
MANDILDMLREDHKKVLDLIDSLQEGGEGTVKSRQNNFSRLKKELLQHMHAEETVFYTWLLDNADDREIVLEAMEEHAAVKMALPGIEHTDVSDEHWEPKLKVMGEMVRHHIEEEEDQIFEQAEQLMEEEINDNLVKDFKQAKRATEITV